MDAKNGNGKKSEREGRKGREGEGWVEGRGECKVVVGDGEIRG